MQCRFCLYNNTEEEERCHRCGIRLSGDITFDGISVEGATVLAPRRISASSETNSDEAAAPRMATGAPLPTTALSNATGAARLTTGAALSNADRQTSLFSGELSNVIPFESFHRPAANKVVKAEGPRNPEPVPAPRPPATAKPTTKKQLTARRTNDAHGNSAQESLNLEFLQPLPPTPRTLKTNVEASIYCDAQVATPMHRSVAAILDAAMILIGCGIFLAIFQFLGGDARFDRFDAIMSLCAVILITMLYGMMFALAGRETAGQNWTELRLVNFDGVAPEGASRALRFAGCWLSFSCLIGVAWALLDEENLTWHDHMSKTFLTMREVDSSFFRERPR